MPGEGKFLFIEYARYHPADLTEKYSNIKVVFSPKMPRQSCSPSI
jgi:hypothetical protein